MAYNIWPPVIGGPTTNGTRSEADRDRMRTNCCTAAVARADILYVCVNSRRCDRETPATREFCLTNLF